VAPIAAVNQSRFGIRILRAETERILGGQWAGGAQGLSERAVFVVGGHDPVGSADQAHDVAVAVVGRHVPSRPASRFKVDPQQAANPSSSLEGAAKVQAPDIGTNQFSSLGVHFRNQVPSVVEEDQVGNRLAGVSVHNGFPNPAPQPVVLEGELIVRTRDVGTGGHLHEPVLAVPFVAPPAVLSQIAVIVVFEHFRIFWDKGVAGGGVVPGLDRDFGILGADGVVDRDNLVEIRSVAACGCAVDLDRGLRIGQAEDVDRPGHRAIGVLVQFIWLVRRHRRSASTGFLSIADVVKDVRQVLPGNFCAVGPIFDARDDLAQVVAATKLV